eukprot:31434-Pelagococcus_subviridis.AAC.17
MRIRVVVVPEPEPEPAAVLPRRGRESSISASATFSSSVRAFTSSAAAARAASARAASAAASAAILARDAPARSFKTARIAGVAGASIVDGDGGDDDDDGVEEEEEDDDEDALALAAVIASRSSRTSRSNASRSRRTSIEWRRGPTAGAPPPPPLPPRGANPAPRRTDPGPPPPVPVSTTSCTRAPAKTVVGSFRVFPTETSSPFVAATRSRTRSRSRSRCGGGIGGGFSRRALALDSPLQEAAFASSIFSLFAAFASSGSFHTSECRGGVQRRQMEIGVHIANAVVWGPVYRTHLNLLPLGQRRRVDHDRGALRPARHLAYRPPLERALEQPRRELLAEAAVPERAALPDAPDVEPSAPRERRGVRVPARERRHRVGDGRDPARRRRRRRARLADAPETPRDAVRVQRERVRLPARRRDDHDDLARIFFLSSSSSSSSRSPVRDAPRRRHRDVVGHVRVPELPAVAVAPRVQLSVVDDRGGVPHAARDVRDDAPAESLHASRSRLRRRRARRAAAAAAAAAAAVPERVKRALAPGEQRAVHGHGGDVEHPDADARYARLRRRRRRRRKPNPRQRPSRRRVLRGRPAAAAADAKVVAGPSPRVQRAAAVFHAVVVAIARQHDGAIAAASHHRARAAVAAAAGFNVEHVVRGAHARRRRAVDDVAVPEPPADAVAPRVHSARARRRDRVPRPERDRARVARGASERGDGRRRHHEAVDDDVMRRRRERLRRRHHARDAAPDEDVAGRRRRGVSAARGRVGGRARALGAVRGGIGGGERRRRRHHRCRLRVASRRRGRASRRLDREPDPAHPRRALRRVLAREI